MGENEVDRLDVPVHKVLTRLHEHLLGPESGQKRKAVNNHFRQGYETKLSPIPLPSDPPGGSPSCSSDSWTRLNEYILEISLPPVRTVVDRQ